MEKIKDVEVQQTILHDMHNVVFMFIEAFKEQGIIKVPQSFQQHAPSDAWISYFWTYCNQFGMCS
jgi:hypothetical protein